MPRKTIRVKEFSSDVICNEAFLFFVLFLQMMRGDRKGPPEATRQKMLEEAEEEKKIAEGPAFRPKRLLKVIKGLMRSLKRNLNSFFF